MDEGKITKIKKAVKGNFELSPAHYQSFEDRYGFFRSLNEALVSGMDLPADADILDVGCGTGASSLQLMEAYAEMPSLGPGQFSGHARDSPLEDQ